MCSLNESQPAESSFEEDTFTEDHLILECSISVEEFYEAIILTMNHIMHRTKPG